ncbi:MAG: hypothetical protein SFV24_26405 [Gemmatimonadales bacterium]|nr:hypothetical protein [Gemmatimonadales bacterium]
MPRPRKPTSILDLTGRLKHDKKRYADRADEPVDNDPIGEPPAAFNEVQQRIWRDVKAELVDGVGLASDRQSFGTLVRLLEKQERNDLTAAELAALIKLYTLFGMTPSDRSRVKAPKKNAAHANPFGQLA